MREKPKGSETRFESKQNDADNPDTHDKTPIEHADRADDGPTEGPRGRNPQQQGGVVTDGSAWDHQEGVPRLHSGLGEAETTFP